MHLDRPIPGPARFADSPLVEKQPDHEMMALLQHERGTDRLARALAGLVSALTILLIICAPAIVYALYDWVR